ncbi:MAG: hypothetical protein JWN89_213 [Parcubacteria group bacterium]|nr:hypothetical protein [Parcubacteria group bacterium]
MKKITRAAIFAVFAAFAILSSSLPGVARANGPGAINLGAAGNFVILTKTGVSTTGSTSVNGDIGVSPVAASYITGFALTLPSASAFSTSALVTGNVYASDYAVPTPSNLTTAVNDMETAYNDGAGRSDTTATELGAGNIGGLTIPPGLYKWGTGVTIPSDVTLSGSANDVWIFQIAQGLNVGPGVSIQLSGGAQAANVFWIVAGQTTIETTAVFNGNILDKTAIVLKTGARLNGRALAQTAVTLDSNTITKVGSNGSPTPTPTPAPVPTPTPSPTPSSSSSGSSGQSLNVTASNGLTIVSQPTDPKIALQQKLDQLVAQLRTLQGQAGSPLRGVMVNLNVGSRGSNVSTLQQFLISQNKGSAARALSSVGATSNFGVMTKAALAEFQMNVGIQPALGNFGPITRAYISAHF